MPKEYLIEQYRILHETGIYGNTSESLKDFIRPLVKALKPRSILDYGCGQSLLLDMLRSETNAELYKYDPAIDKHKTLVSQRMDMVICTDVLEHIPEDDLDDILKTIKTKSGNVVFTICCREAVYSLPDGQNCHCTVKQKKWWVLKLRNFFPYINTFSLLTSDYFLCTTFKINWKAKVQILLVRLKLNKMLQRLYRHRYVKSIYRFIFKQNKRSRRDKI